MPIWVTPQNQRKTGYIKQTWIIIMNNYLVIIQKIGPMAHGKTNVNITRTNGMGIDMNNELEQLLEIIESQQIEIDSLRKQIDDISELVILLMHMLNWGNDHDNKTQVPGLWAALPRVKYISRSDKQTPKHTGFW